ncbi:Transmembrane protein 14C [Coemansia thaxteri]|nr:Transmembrane protein 14C [Coemansia thaxteri]
MYVSGMEAQSALVAASLFTRHLSGSADLAKQLAETTAAVLCESSAPASVALGSEIVVSASGKAVRQLAAGADTVKAEDLGTSASIHVDFLAVPEANAMDINAFADWLFDCDCVVIVADRAGIAQTLTGTKSFLQCLQLHPSTLHVLTGLGTSHATVSSFSGLLREVLGSLGLPISSAIDSAYWLTPAEALLSQDMEAAQPDLLHGDLTARLASAIRAAILCAEHGGSTAVVQAGRGLSAPQIGSTTAFSTAGLSKALLACLDSAARSDIKSLSPVSKHIQHGFEGTDLLTVDASIGATKSRVRAWFAGGTVWQSALMRVFEVSDTLIDDAILQRYLEGAELGMVHAAGRLNESIRNSASRLANELNCLRESANSTDTEALDAEIVSARDALRAVAVQSEAVGKFVLARHVWSMQKRLAENDEFLDSIPGYVRWSLAQFWAIGASALATSVCSAVYFGVPLVYATSGGLGLLALAFLWLGRRWRVLEARVHRHLDSQCASLRSELAAAHRQVLIAAIDQPLLRHTSKLAAAFGRGHQDAGGNKIFVMPLDILGLSFAVFIALGGVVGYLKSNSTASLASGLVFCALISLSVQFAAGASFKSANVLPACICAVLFLVMGARFQESRKVMPAGMVAATSLLMAARYGLKALL